MEMHDAVQVASTGLSESIGRTLERLENEAETFNQDEAFFALVSLIDLKSLVRGYETRLNQLLTQCMRLNGDKYLEYGSMVVERKYASTRKNWEHNVLIEAVVNRALSNTSGTVVDPSTGEIVDIANISRPLIDAVVDGLVKTAAIRDWRVTALRAMIPGLNPDDFCEVEKMEKVSIRNKQ